MVAVVRSVATATISGVDSAQVSRGAAQPGDLLLAFHSADNGTASQMLISGGSGGWTRIGSRGAEFWPGTEIYMREAVTGEPTSYTVTQDVSADGVVHIVAIRGARLSGIQIQGRDGTTAPSLTPTTASGIQIRYAAGWPFPPGAAVSWSAPSAYTLSQVQSHPWMTAALAYRSFSSATPLGQVTLTPGVELVEPICFTVAVQSAPEPEPPAVPTYPPFAPARGTSRYLYFFRRLLDGQLLGSLDLAGVTFDKRILQPGSFSATIPIPSRRIADQVAEIIPRTPEELTTGPGVIVVDIWRDGQPWGEYWITAATIGRSRRGVPEIQLRGSTLDAFLGNVEIREDLDYTGTDQIEIARQLITHMQSQTGANIGLALQDGTCGVNRTVSYLESEGGTYGQRLTELAQIDDGFEWMINIGVENGTITRQWVWGYPRLGQTTTGHVFADTPRGGDILEWGEEIDALRGATSWRVRGGTPPDDVDASTTSTSLVSSAHNATAHLDAGWPRLDRTLSYSTITDQQTLEDYAAYWAATAPGAVWVDSLTVALGAEPSFTPNNLGDMCRIYLDNEWHAGHWRTRRIIGVAITPTSRQTGREEAQLILESVEVD